MPFHAMYFFCHICNTAMYFYKVDKVDKFWNSLASCKLPPKIFFTNGDKTRSLPIKHMLRDRRVGFAACLASCPNAQPQTFSDVVLFSFCFNTANDAVLVIVQISKNRYTFIIHTV